MDSLYPRNFIWTLKTPNEYIGPNQIFGFNDPGKPDGLDIKRWIPDEDLDQIAALYDGSGSEIPESMKDAICWFVCAVAVMRNWQYKKPISMLVHTSQKQANHDAVANAISCWIGNSVKSNTFINRCRLVYEVETTRLPKHEWCSQFSDYGIPESEIHDYPQFDDILPEISLLISEKSATSSCLNQGILNTGAVSILSLITAQKTELPVKTSISGWPTLIRI